MTDDRSGDGGGDDGDDDDNDDDDGDDCEHLRNGFCVPGTDMNASRNIHLTLATLHGSYCLLSLLCI